MDPPRKHLRHTIPNKRVNQFDTAIPRAGPWRDAVLKQSVEAELPSGRYWILEIDGLIRAKEAMDRDQDRITVRQLRQVKKRQQSG